MKNTIKFEINVITQENLEGATDNNDKKFRRFNQKI